MPTYHIYGIVTGSKYLGEVEAENEEMAKEKAFEELDMHCSLCWHCAEEIEDPEITDISAEIKGE